MKKLSVLCILYSVSVAVCTLPASAKEAVSNVWTGSKALSWGEEVETGNATAAAEGRKLRITFTATGESPQMQVYHKDASWAGVDLASGKTIAAPTFEVVLSAVEATNAKERGLYIKGQDATLTSVDIVYEEKDPDPTPDPDPDPTPDPETLQPGETKVLWEGSETLAWNDVAEQSASVGALLAEKDHIIVTVSAKGSIEWPKLMLRDLSYKEATDDILLNEVSTFPYEANFTLTAAQVAALKNGFRLCGDGVTVTKMVLKKYKEGEDPDPTPDPDPTTDPDPQPGQPIDLDGLQETVLWTGSRAISWNSGDYAGDKFDTYAQQQDMFAGLKVGDVIAVSVEADGEAEYALKYKAGDDWTWTVLPINTQTVGLVAYQVDSEEIAQLIADRGLVLDGIRYKATKISLYATPSEQGIESVQVMFDGIRINLLGQRVDANYKGIVILNSKKTIQY